MTRVDASSGPATRNQTDWDALVARVGNTPLRAADRLGSELGIPRLLLKCEQANPTGSHKDRMALAQVTSARSAGVSTIAVSSLGTHATSLARFAQAAGIACAVHAPEGVPPTRLDALAALGARVEQTKLGPDELAPYSRDEAARQGWFDANLSSDNAEPARVAYAPIASEILAALRQAPASVAIPSAGGSTLVGVGEGFRKSHPDGSGPRLIAATTQMGNPIVYSLAYQHEACEDLDPDAVVPTAISEPLARRHAVAGTFALEAVRASRGWGYAAKDPELDALSKRLHELEGIDVVPAAVAGIAALRFAAQLERLEPDRPHVALLTQRS